MCAEDVAIASEQGFLSEAGGLIGSGSDVWGWMYLRMDGQAGREGGREGGRVGVGVGMWLQHSRGGCLGEGKGERGCEGRGARVSEVGRARS